MNAFIITCEPAQLRAHIVEQYYRPYRVQVERFVRQAVSRGHCVIHVSSDSFTAEVNGNLRGADVGLLYDPSRRGEVAVCARWKESLAALAPDLRVHRNYPYEDKGDGLTSLLRRRFGQNLYVGFELEVNQEHRIRCRLALDSVAAQADRVVVHSMLAV